MKFVSNREWALLARILAFSIVPTLGGLLRVVELGEGGRTNNHPRKSTCAG